jgi:hypothetical protein
MADDIVQTIRLVADDQTLSGRLRHLAACSGRSLASSSPPNDARSGDV